MINKVSKFRSTLSPFNQLQITISKPSSVKMEEGDMFQECGLCSKRTEDMQSVSPGLSGFLQEFLKLPPDRLPALLCADCHDSSTRAREFRAQCGLLASKQDFLQQIGQEEIASMVSGFLPAAKKSKNC